MSALTLCVYLILFYFLPLTGGPVYQWVWVHAREKLPWLMFYHHGALVWNGAFYAAMLGLWVVCYLVCALFRLLVRRDDQQWEGLFTGFQRGAGLGWADALLAVLFAALLVFCFTHNYPVHGPLSALLPVVGTFCIPALMPGRSRKRANEAVQKGRRSLDSANSSVPVDAAHSGAASEPTATAEPLNAAGDTASHDSIPSISMATRELGSDEPPPIDVEALREHVERVVSIEGAVSLSLSHASDDSVAV